jgi:hypothetical protein
MWGEAVTHWLRSPIFGFGPGSFAREFATTGYYSEFDGNVPHAHNAVVQLLFESGLLGLAAVLLIVLGLGIGIHRGRSIPWPIAGLVIFFALASLTDNPTVVPFLIVVLLLWIALAIPRTEVPASSQGTRWVARLSLGLLAPIAFAAVAVLAGGWAFDRARDAADAGDPGEVVQSLRLAALLDPANALYHRELGVREDQPSAAREELQRAIQLNPSDEQARRALALVLSTERNRTALDVASDLREQDGLQIENHLLAAFVAKAQADFPIVHQALTRAVQLAPWITGAPEWQAVFPDANTTQLLRDAQSAWLNSDEASARNIRARAWLAGLSGDAAPVDASIALRLEAAVLSCDVVTAGSLSANLSHTKDAESLRAQILYARLVGSDQLPALLEQLKLRDPASADLSARPRLGSALTVNAFYDDRYYNRLALPAALGRPFPTTASGLSAWLRDPVGTAQIAMPSSALAGCQ